MQGKPFPRRRFLRRLAGLSFVAGLPRAGLAAAGKPRVARGVFTTAVKDREPVDQVLRLTNDHREIYFFTELRHFTGQTVIHRWEYEGNMVTERKFEVGGPRWRVASRKGLNPGMTGRWSVVVLDGEGWPVYTAIFEYVKKSDYPESAILPPPPPP